MISHHICLTIISRSIHVVANDVIPFFLSLNHIPLYICSIVHTIPACENCLGGDIKIFQESIHSSVNGHLSCFHVLALARCTVMNIRVRVSSQIAVFSRYMPRSGIAGSYGKSKTGFLAF